jgi:LmbE family N-acetylglucosaminyl deacetylase
MGKDLRLDVILPHLCKVNFLGRNNLAVRSCPIRGCIRVLFLQILCLLCLSLTPVLLLGSPQQAEKGTQSNAASAVVSRDAATAAATFPQLPYQGTPPELPQDKGLPGLRLMLKRLGTTARLMQTVAHPDDEDGGMLTLESRGRGDAVLLMTLNRGEGGQNKVGSNLSDVLGVLRTLELLAADEYYGVQERFSRVADFGFSKSADETFAKWGGHDIALADMVRVIRTFHPDVLVARFSGTDRDGHGHHQASSILTREAFRAAADPKRFPEQIAEGLSPWQAKKLYIGNVCGFGASTCPDADWTVRLNTGENSTDLGMSYIQFAMEGLRHQMSQGAANWTVEPGDRFTFYKLVDSVQPAKLDKNGHEKDFFDGIDASLPGLAGRLGSEQNKVPQLRGRLSEAANQIAEANRSAVANNPSAALNPLVRTIAELETAAQEATKSGLSANVKSDLLMRLQEKRDQTEAALNDALNISLTATVTSRAGAIADSTGSLPREESAITTVSPGQDFMVAVDFHNGSGHQLVVNAVKLEVPQGWSTTSDNTRPIAIKPGENVHVVFRLRVPKDAAYTRPYWHRDDPNTESVNHVDNEKYATLPFPPPLLRARVEYSLPDSHSEHTRSGIGATVVALFADDAGKPAARPLAVVPAFSVALEPGTQVISTHNGASSIVKVGVAGNLNHETQGKLRLELPQGWRSEPSEAAVELTSRGEKKDFQFKVFPANLQQSRSQLRALLGVGDDAFSEGYTLVAREDLGSFYYYQPALQRVSIVDVNVPHDLKIGYIMGAGDDIPTVLQQIGMDVTLIPADRLRNENLSQYGTIVLGIRAYDTQRDVVANNQRLLDFVAAGGTLLVQYNTAVGDFNGEHLTPYPAELSRARVSVEEAPVDILDPGNQIFHSPNTLTSTDFDGWVQERGLYFMNKWDDHFKPLLSCHDPGESPQKGGLLETQYGKGIYIYTGYAFFRQLPAGVPGAVRLYVNLLSADHEGIH